MSETNPISPRADLNVMPVILTIVDQFNDDSEAPLSGWILNAAVHGWMEGHLAAPGHRYDPDNRGAMPAPPFPPADNPGLKAIVDDACSRFVEGEEPAAIAYATALGWQAGRQAGMDCPGCSPAGDNSGDPDHPMASALRNGRADIRFVRKGMN